MLASFFNRIDLQHLNAFKQETFLIFQYFSYYEQLKFHAHIGLSEIFERKSVIFSNPSVRTYVLGAQKNRLVETVLLSTHIICFGWEIRKLFFFW